MNEKVKIRDERVDIVRGLAIFFVVLGHSMQAYTIGNSFYPLHQIILAFQMPLFMFISGYSAGFGLPINDYKKYVIKEIKILLIPYISWAFINYFITLITYKKSFAFSQLFNTLFLSQFWFLRHLFVIYILMIIMFYLYDNFKIVKYEISRMGLSFVITTVIAFVLNKLQFIGTSGIIGYYFCFFIGLLCFNYKNTFKKYFKIAGFYSTIISLFSITILLLFTSTGIFEKILTNKQLYNLIFQIDRKIIAVFGIGAICYCTNFIYLKFGSNFLSRFVCYCGKKTLAIYAIHWCLLFASGVINYKYLINYLNLSYGFMVIITFLIWLILSLMIEYLIDKLKPLRMLLFGKRY